VAAEARNGHRGATQKIAKARAKDRPRSEIGDPKKNWDTNAITSPSLLAVVVALLHCCVFPLVSTARWAGNKVIKHQCIAETNLTS
jgi:cytochrome c-type biogenesis protein CcmH/NrfG